MDSKTFFIGQRVILDGIHLGTVRYFDKIEGEEDHQNWLGIEWDDPSRGKHSGQFKNGPVLFETWVPNSATFMKPSVRLNTGRSFLTALKEKYFDEDLIITSQGDKVTTTQDMDKNLLQVAKLDRLRLIGLESSRINGPGDEFELIELDGLLPSVETLDLSSNMFCNMDDISTIAEKLPQLKSLNLSSNRFKLISNNLTGLREIKTLYLDSTLLTWKQSIQVACQMKALFELSLSSCRLLDLGAQSFSNHMPSIESLSVLTLDQNGLTDWGDLINSLKLLPRLQRLNLRKNQLRITSRTDQTTTYESLRYLSLAENSIQLGDEIDHLRDWFPSLISLFLNGNPLYDLQDSRHSRLLAIARFPTLTHLDGSEIMLAERVEADKFYWSTIQKEVIDPNRLANSHRRYSELLAIFGPPDIASTKTPSNSLKAKMINLSIIWPDHLQIENSNIQVLPSMTGRGLRIYLAKMIRRFNPEHTQNLDELAGNLEIYIIINRETNLDRLLDLTNNQKTLEWYGIDHDDALRVELKTREGQY